MKYSDAKWTTVDRSDRLKLTKTEAQVSIALMPISSFPPSSLLLKVWLALYQLLMNPDCQQKYELNNHNKQSILKVTT